MHMNTFYKLKKNSMSIILIINHENNKHTFK